MNSKHKNKNEGEVSLKWSVIWVTWGFLKGVFHRYGQPCFWTSCLASSSVIMLATCLFKMDIFEIKSLMLGINITTKLNYQALTLHLGFSWVNRKLLDMRNFPEGLPFSWDSWKTPTHSLATESKCFGKERRVCEFLLSAGTKMCLKKSWPIWIVSLSW